MTAHPPTAHTYSPASAPSASTPALPVDEPDDLSGPSGSAEAGAGERLIDRIERSDILRIAVVGMAVLGAWVAGATGTPGWAVGAVGAAALLVGCWPLVVEAVGDLRERRMSMELSMLLAIVAAAAIGEWVTALAVTVFALCAEVLEDLSMDRGRDALTDLMSFLPQTARVVTGPHTDEASEVPLDEVRPGQVIALSPGGRVPVDGVVRTGRADVDQSRITGEALPVQVGPGDRVPAGSITRGALELEVERVGEDSSYGRIVAAVRYAQSSRAPVQRLADKVSAVFVPAVIAIAAIAFATRLALGNPLEMALASAITVLVVACPCALGLATPTALLVGSGRASRLGILIKGPETLESAHGVQTIVLDKTGTLTTGTMAVSAVRPAEGVGERELLAAAAGVERGSEHPIAKAIVALAHERGIEPKAVESVAARAGNGVEGILDGRRIAAGTARWLAEEGVEGASGLGGEPGASVVGVALEGSLLGAFDIRDAVRPESAAAVAELKSLGLHPVLATGDNEAAAAAVAAEVGIDDVRAGILPEGKVGIVEELRAAGQKVAMVGDGVNDAAALAGADLSIAMGSGADVAKEAADITVVSSDIRSVGAAIRISAQTLRIIKENLAWAFGYNVVAIPVAVAGFIVPGIAAAAMASSSVIVVANSLRLRRA